MAKRVPLKPGEKRVTEHAHTPAPAEGIKPNPSLHTESKKESDESKVAADKAAADDKAAKEKEAKVKAADDKVKTKQDAVTKANAAAVAAHSELMDAQRERVALDIE